MFISPQISVVADRSMAKKELGIDLALADKLRSRVFRECEWNTSAAALVPYRLLAAPMCTWQRRRM